MKKCNSKRKSNVKKRRTIKRKKMIRGGSGTAAVTETLMRVREENENLKGQVAELTEKLIACEENLRVKTTSTDKEWSALEAIGDVVLLIGGDEEIPDGTFGQIVHIDNMNPPVVKFPELTGSFREEEIVPVTKEMLGEKCLELQLIVKDLKEQLLQQQTLHKTELEPEPSPLRPSASSTPSRVSPPAVQTTFWLGSTEQEVIDILGEPTSIHDHGRMRLDDRVHFESAKDYEYNTGSEELFSQPDRIVFENGRVVSYSNNSGTLPISCRIDRKFGETFTLGSTEKDVLGILGEPTSVHDYGRMRLDDTESAKDYEYNTGSEELFSQPDRIVFENGRVVSYSNNSGTLPISLTRSSGGGGGGGGGGGKGRPRSRSPPHKQTSLGYHQSKLERLEEGEGGVSQEHENFQVGQRVIYRSKRKGEEDQEAEILSIDRELDDVEGGDVPYVTIKLLDGTERQTTIDCIQRT